MSVKNVSYRSLMIFLYALFLLLFVACSIVFFTGCEKQHTPPVSKTQPPAAAEAPKQQPGGHFHADGTWHAEPHAPPQEQAVVENTPPPAAVAPDNPEGLPYPMTDENRHQWKTVLTAADEDPELLQRLLPRTEAQGEEMLTNMMNCNSNETGYRNVRAAIYSELCKIAPNNYVWFINATIWLPQQTDTEKRVVIEYYEAAKRLAKAQGQRIQTNYLGHYYRDLGEYEKAIAEIRDQWDLLQDLQRTGRTNRGTFRRFLALEEADRLQKRLEEQRSKKNETQRLSEK